MRRLRQENINTPNLYDGKIPTSFGVTDMERLWKLVKYYKGGTYLDIGCNDSIMPALLAERSKGDMIWAIDHSKELIDFLKPRFPKVKYVASDCLTIPISADYIVAGELIEHLEEPQKAINVWLNALKTGGWLAISTPHEEQHGEVGGAQHLWSYTVQDMYDFGFTEVEVLQEARHKTILAWRQK